MGLSVKLFASVQSSSWRGAQTGLLQSLSSQLSRKIHENPRDTGIKERPPVMLTDMRTISAHCSWTNEAALAKLHHICSFLYLFNVYGRADSYPLSTASTCLIHETLGAEHVWRESSWQVFVLWCVEASWVTHQVLGNACPRPLASLRSPAANLCPRCLLTHQLCFPLLPGTRHHSWIRRSAFLLSQMR